MRKINNNLCEIAKQVLLGCMGLKQEETLLVVTDTLKHKIGEAFYLAGLELGCESLIISMGARQVAGEEPPQSVANAMLGADVIICPTEESLTHTNARINAVSRGARVGTMPGITEDMFMKGAMTADFKCVEALTRNIASLLTKAKKATIKKDKCVLEFNLEGREGVESTGVYKIAGMSGNLPSGEAYIAPLEDGVIGTTIIDGSIEGVGVLDTPLYADIKNGRLTQLEGESARVLNFLFDKIENGIVAELGIGTNDKALLCGNILEDEKVYGTVHIAFGTNTSFGGVNKADCHIDGIILRPTLYLDDQLIIKDGEFIFKQ